MADLDGATRLPLSCTQEFLCMFDQGDDQGPFSPRYNIVSSVRLRGPVDLDALRAALSDVVARHESLRTSIARGEQRYQTVHPPSQPELTVRELATGGEPRDLVAEAFVNSVDAGTYSVQALPHLTAVLGRFDPTDAVLALAVHHTATDGWSSQLIVRDLAACYGARVGGGEPALPPVRQYREFAEHERASLGTPAADESRAYWREKLRGGQLVAVPTDQLRSAGLPKLTSIHRFMLPAELSTATLELAKGLRSSPFMLLLAAYGILLRKLTGITDTVIPVITSGRRWDEFNDTVGPVFNFVPFRTDLAGATSFRDVVERTRTTCLEALLYELPFLQIAAEAPELMAPLMRDDSATVAIQVVQFPSVLTGDVHGGVEFAELRKRLVSQDVGEDIPDGALLTLDLDEHGDLVGRLGFNTNLYDQSTMVDLVTEFERVLRNGVAAPDEPL